MAHVLFVEDDNGIVENLTGFLTNEGFEVTAAAGQREALALISQTAYDLALLDISLADGNGFAVCSYIKQNTDIPVIFLTAFGDEYSVVSGLDMGADDYINKPFRPRELVARINSVLRRAGKAQSVIQIGDLTVDIQKATVKKGTEELSLSALEYRILLLLCQNRGAVLTRDRLLEEIWDASGEFVNDNTLTVYIKRLREKIETDAAEPRLIKTVRGIGYRID